MLLNALKAVFLIANACMAGMLLWDVGPRMALLVLVLPAVLALAVWRRGWIPAVLACFGAVLPFFGFQSYAVHAQVLHWLVSLVALLCLAANIRDRAGEDRLAAGSGAVGGFGLGPLRLWMLAFVGVMAAGLPLLPVGEFVQAAKNLGFLDFVRMAAYSVARSSLYALAALDRLLLFALLAWELSRLKGGRMLSSLCEGIAAGLCAALAFGLVEFFGAGGTAFAMNDRLSSLFLNPGWFAEYLCVAFPFLFVLGRGRSWPLLSRAALLGVTAAALAAMMLTMARAAWLVFGGLAVGSMVLAMTGWDFFALNYRRMAKGAALGLIAVVVLAAVVYGALAVSRISLLNFPLATMMRQRLERFSESPRPTVFKSGLLIGLESPLTGMGYETYAWHYPRLMASPASSLARNIDPKAEVFEATHNLFIQVFVGGGLLALIAWCLMAGRVFQLELRRHRRRADALSLGMLGALAAFHAFGLFQEMLYVPAVWLLFFIMLAHAMRLEDQEGGWAAPAAARRWTWAVGGVVAAALLLNLAGAGFGGGAREPNGADSAITADKANSTDNAASASDANTADRTVPVYPADLQGLSGPEVVDGYTAMWSCGASSFRLVGEGPWMFTLGCGQPGLETKPVEAVLRTGASFAVRAVFDARHGRQAVLTIPREAGQPGGRVYLQVSRAFYPINAGVKDYRRLGVWIAGPGLP